MRLATRGALGPATSVRCCTEADGSPSYFRVKAMTMMRYSVNGPTNYFNVSKNP